MDYDELVQQLQSGAICYNEFVERSLHAGDYASWLSEHGVEASDENAEVFLREQELDMTFHSFTL